MNKVSKKAHLRGVKAHPGGGRMKKRNGFTLVEMLVVISVLGIAGILILTVFTRTLRGNTKAQIVTSIKQNGQSVLENMDKTVRNADRVVCPAVIVPATSGSGATLVVVKDGCYSRYRFTDPTSTLNGYIQQDNPYYDIPCTSPSPSPSPFPSPSLINDFEDNVCSTSLENANTLTDTNPQTGTSVNCTAPDCNLNKIFTRIQSAGFGDRVIIKFDLKPGVLAPQAIAGQIDPVNFQTTVVLRNK